MFAPMQPLYAFRVDATLTSSRIASLPLLFTISTPVNFFGIWWIKVQNMSSPSHRRQRSSQSGTPKRTSRKSSQPIPSSEPDVDPSAAQLQEEMASSQSSSRGKTPHSSRRGVPSSSPMIYRSSPAIGTTSSRNVDRSSPLRQVFNDYAMIDDGNRTPRASGNLMAGM